jgi:hypothetical protein
MLFLEDLPTVKIAPLRAAGLITADMTETVIRLGEKDFTVALSLRRFPNGGSWSLFRCFGCGRGAQVLRLLGDQPSCRNCCYKQGVRHVSVGKSPRRRAMLYAPKLLAKPSAPARLHSRPGRVLDRRARLEAILREKLLLLREADAKRMHAVLADAIAGRSASPFSPQARSSWAGRIATMTRVSMSTASSSMIRLIVREANPMGRKRKYPPKPVDPLSTVEGRVAAAIEIMNRPRDTRPVEVRLFDQNKQARDAAALEILDSWEARRRGLHPHRPKRIVIKSIDPRSPLTLELHSGDVVIRGAEGSPVKPGGR